MPAAATPFLSIVVPFHNSARTCRPLLDTLARLGPDDGVELVLVDDGSTDDTRAILHDFAGSRAANTIVIERENGGPGAARNSGLDRASGKFVWFVDSDDDIDLGAIAAARPAGWDVDLVAWEWEHPTIRRRIPPGVHRASAGPFPPDWFDPIVANWYSLDFLRRTGLRFPEHCFYEASPIEAFVLPLLVTSCAKSDFVAYKANTSSRSVTRGAKSIDPRWFDRLQTVSLGMAYVRRSGLEPSARAPFEHAFAKHFLWHTIRLSKHPGRSWLLAARVMRHFRDEARRLGVRADPFSSFPGRRHSKLLMRALWLLSYALPRQARYFDRLHMSAWGRPVSWQRPRPAGG